MNSLSEGDYYSVCQHQHDQIMTFRVRSGNIEEQAVVPEETLFYSMTHFLFCPEVHKFLVNARKGLSFFKDLYAADHTAIDIVIQAACQCNGKCSGLIAVVESDGLLQRTLAKVPTASGKEKVHRRKPLRQARTCHALHLREEGADDQMTRRQWQSPS